MNATVSSPVEAAVAHWAYVREVLTPPENEADFERLVAMLDEVLDAGGADENHELASLAERMGELVAAYEARHVPELNVAAGIDVLRHLMAEHGLTQSDLPEIGPQPVVSAVLRGQRELNLRQVSSLARRFGVAMEAFVNR